MKNFQTKLDVIGNNIANVNTYGFKKGRVTFSDTISQTIAGANAATANMGGTNAKQIGLGSNVASIDTIQTQSSTQSTGRNLDLAISGDGYFVVKNGDVQRYTRAGNFYLDDAGTLVTSDGNKVQAYKVDTNGNVAQNYSDVTINMNEQLPAVATKKMEITGNLAANSTAGANSVYSQQLQVTNDQGKPESLTVYFRKNAPDSWGVYIKDPSKTTGGQIGTTDITFKPDGSINTSPTSVSITRWSDGAFETSATYPGTIPTPAPTQTTQTFTLDFTKLTQKSGTTAVQVAPDGHTGGKLESFNFSPTGEINGVYSNGYNVTLGQLAIATFSNSSGLVKSGTNMFQESVNSGTANVSVAGNGRGSIVANSLEMSNVDLSEEFSEMIIAQRAFQSNTKMITTSDEILQEIMGLKR